MGDGEQIKVFEDPWLTRPFSFKPVARVTNENLLVAGLLDDSGQQWNIEILNQVFLEVDKEAILKIPLSYKRKPDKLIWHYDKRGIYRVKSGYQVALRNKVRDLSSGSSVDSGWWIALWNLNIPPKVRIFVWRVCNNAIPSLTNLVRRKIVDDLMCLRCEKAEESVEHALLWCRKAKEIWSKSIFWCLISNLKGLNSQDMLRFVFSKTRRDDLAFFCVVIWCLLSGT
ncbi:hypothetical protein Dsin_005974 [Dipteronia sinensis]|uniref:Reverse transcriptase zinc-binding domain-containing protein n=1 Tax=Dipteronia sinensis TaxID=43782 RepID=A0AAE0AXV0_9ROSI|nr:hypothetical protein Dsin_005974 [Dipteronia sinensis]